MTTQYARHSSGVKSVSKSIPEMIEDKNSGARYLRGSFLGKGGFAYCYKLTDVKTKKVYAGKIVAKSTLTKHRAKEKLRSEIQIHRSLKHKFVVDFHSVFEDRENVYIILELCPNQSMMELHKKRHALTEVEARYYLAQIALATKYMHDRNVIHRDLKLGNLFLGPDMDVKVGDFGLATTITYDGERKKTLCGTPNYIAPEILEGRAGHSFEVDMWSIGCILYTMLFGKPPFETRDVKTTYRRIRRNEYSFPSSIRVSPQAEDLVRRLLSADPSNRPGPQQVLEHPFIADAFIPAILPVTSLTIRPTIARDAEQMVIDTSTFKPSSAKTAHADTKSKGNRAPLSSRTNRSQQQAIQSEKPPQQQQFAAQRQADIAAPVRRGSSTQRKSSTELCERLHTRVLNVIAQQSKAQDSTPPQVTSVAEAKKGCAITKWVDYSFKYGLGYKLSNGTVGVLFNDNTKMVLAADGHNVEFTDRERKGAAMTPMTLDGYPDAFKKKITLLKYFRDYMRDNLQDGPSEIANEQAGYESGLPVINKWLRTQHAIVFRMNVGIVQVNFFDHTKLILNGPRDTVTYIDKDAVTSTYFLSGIADSNHPSIETLSSRIVYASDILGHILSKQQRS